MAKSIDGFSKYAKKAKLQWIKNNYLADNEEDISILESFWHPSAEVQKVLDGFSENTVSNFAMPFGLAPNFSINGEVYCVPMVIEESSVVAAAAAAAKYWFSRGGFCCEVLSTKKVGQLHFSWSGESSILKNAFTDIEHTLRIETQHLTANMQTRGGGILDLELLDLTHLEADYYQIRATFETCDSMGANFINSVLEEFGHLLKNIFKTHQAFAQSPREVSIIMAILSNYTPECVVRASVECPVEALADKSLGMEAGDFAEKFSKAVRIAEIDPYRATTHNKGIFNGIDAVILATANDFRAIEACGHAYAARDGQYRSLSHCKVENGIFRFWLDVPLAVGTVGGLTKLHPLAKTALAILGQPSAQRLMEIVAAVGLAQNFAALRSLTTTGIQKGHMKMHLMNILNHLGANDDDCELAIGYFEDKVVSFSSVRAFLELRREISKR
jgi:hydroxymethylglutaryl-CoA reductase